MDRPLRLLSIGAHPADVFDQSGGTMAHHSGRGDYVACIVVTHGARVHDVVISEEMSHREEIPDADELVKLMAERSDVKTEGGPGGRPDTRLRGRLLPRRGRRGAAAHGRGGAQGRQADPANPARHPPDSLPERGRRHHERSCRGRPDRRPRHWPGRRRRPGRHQPAAQDHRDILLRHRSRERSQTPCGAPKAATTTTSS